jgi:hypothetical protein
MGTKYSLIFASDLIMNAAVCPADAYLDGRGVPSIEHFEGSFPSASALTVPGQ